MEFHHEWDQLVEFLREFLAVGEQNVMIRAALLYKIGNFIKVFWV